MASPEATRMLDFWSSKLAGAPTLELPLSYARPKMLRVDKSGNVLYTSAV